MAHNKQPAPEVTRAKEEMKMNISNIVLKKVSGPPFNTVVFNAQDGVIFPCIVKDGQYFSKNGRLSNFWRWINLYTMREESGYGCFYVATSF